MRPASYRDQMTKCCATCKFAVVLADEVHACFHGEPMSNAVVKRAKNLGGDAWLDMLENRSVSPTGLCNEFDDGNTKGTDDV